MEKNQCPFNAWFPETSFWSAAEIIPADGILLKGSAQIDYSFVTGEANPWSNSGDGYSQEANNWRKHRDLTYQTCFSKQSDTPSGTTMQIKRPKKAIPPNWPIRQANILLADPKRWRWCISY
ncbi:MAG: hypothetical protein R2778_09350 [Saprospiraceae bacterium]